ncbi:diguanylate cyclase (GGDEF)-like protein [Lachnospiraceae bacterium PM6-15]
MTNMAVAIVYVAILIVIIVFFMVTYTGGNRKRPVAKAFLFMAVMSVCWVACEILYHLTQNATVARLLYDYKIPFVTLAATSTVPFVFYFYGLNRRLNRMTYVLLYLIPAVTTLFALTSPLHTLLRQKLVVNISPVLHTDYNVRGIWFWVHTLQVYLTLLCVVFFVIRQHYKTPRSKRAASNFLLFGITSTMALSIVSVSNIIKTPFDITLIGICVALVFFYIGTAISEKAGFLSLARDEVFNNMHEMVFVLHADDTIAEMNKSAKHWMEKMRIITQGGFDEILESLKGAGAEIYPAPEEGTGMDIHFSTPQGDNVIINYKENVITDDDGVKGKFYLCSDVTKSRAIFHQLAEHAELDPLTGLQNRRGFEMATHALDTPSNLPLTVIFGDLNGLKATNDTYGHKQGDQLIITAAALLRNACPPSGRLFRIGGDEFVMLIPNFTEELAEQRLCEINNLFATTRNLPIQPSIALGYAAKNHPEESLLAVIEEADGRMYKNKQEAKGA